MPDSIGATGRPYRIRVTTTVAPAKIKVIGTPGPQGPPGAQGVQGNRGPTGTIAAGLPLDGGNF